MSGGDFVKVKKVAWGGYFQLLQTPFGSAAAKEHRPNAPFQYGGIAGAAQAPYWSLFVAAARTMKINVMH
jgi:hypothetical protein